MILEQNSIIELLKQIYNWLIPNSLKHRISIFRHKNEPIGILRNKILNYYSSRTINDITNEEKNVIFFLKNNPLQIIPYKLIYNYDYRNIDVYFDYNYGLNYVFHNGKKMYFKRSLNKMQVKILYNQLLIEQDLNSPHRYLTDYFQINENDTIADIGAAEGNFSLDIIEKVKKILLFEADSEWIEALRCTFQPWKGKVTIVNKYVSNIDSSNEITLDTYYKNEKFTFLKLDVEGAELKVLDGCKSILSENIEIKIVACCYHKMNDEYNIRQFLEKYSFYIYQPKGYMIYMYDAELKEPYLKRGVIRAIKY